MARYGWFTVDAGGPAAGVPAQCVAAAQTMIESEDFPPDAAIAWAQGALAAKRLVAARHAALGEDDGFATAAAAAEIALAQAATRWHGVLRASACLLQSTQQLDSAGGSFTWLQFKRLRVEELGFALRSGASPAALLRLTAAQSGLTLAGLEEADAAEVDGLAGCCEVLSANVSALAALRADWTAETALPLPDTAARDSILYQLARLAADFAGEAEGTVKALHAARSALRDRAADLPGPLYDALAALLTEDARALHKQLLSAVKLTNWRTAIERPQLPAYTAVDVSIRMLGAPEGQSRVLSGRARPRRAPPPVFRGCRDVFGRRDTGNPTAARAVLSRWAYRAQHPGRRGRANA